MKPPSACRSGSRLISRYAKITEAAPRASQSGVVRLRVATNTPTNSAPGSAESSIPLAPPSRPSRAPADCGGYRPCAADGTAAADGGAAVPLAPGASSAFTLPGLRYLGPAHIRVQRLAVSPSRLGHLFLERLLRLRGQAEREHVARRHRMVTTDNHGVGEHILEDLGVPRIPCSRPFDHTVQEPTRPVRAEEPGWLQRPGTAGATAGWAGLVGHPGADFHAEGACRLLRVASRAGQLLDDLVPDVVPEPRALGRGERLQLQHALAAHDEGRDSLVAGDSELKAAPRRGGHLQAAEVDAVPFGITLRHVPRAAPATLHRIPARRFGVVVAVLGRPIIQGLGRQRLVCANGAPTTEHPSRSLSSVTCLRLSRPRASGRRDR